MERASAAVDCLSNNMLTELKSLSKPPDGVDLVTTCCLIMLEGERKNWKRLENDHEVETRRRSKEHELALNDKEQTHVRASKELLHRKRRAEKRSASIIGHETKDLTVLAEINFKKPSRSDVGDFQRGCYTDHPILLRGKSSSSSSLRPRNQGYQIYSRNALIL